MVIKTSGGTSASAPSDEFTYLPAPKVTSVSPDSGPSAGGSSVTISGQFSNVSQVTFGSTSATYLMLSDGDISAVSPAGSGKQTVNIVATCPAGDPVPSTCGASKSKVSFTFDRA